MIEEIKKEIEQVLFTIDTTALEAGIAQKQIFEILDKYNNQMFGKHTLEDIIYKVEQYGYKVISNDEFNNFVQLLLNYKNAWEELEKKVNEIIQTYKFMPRIAEFGRSKSNFEERTYSKEFLESFYDNL